MPDSQAEIMVDLSTHGWVPGRDQTIPGWFPLRNQHTLAESEWCYMIGTLWISGSCASVVRRREMFCEIVTKIGKARTPIYLKMFLSHKILDLVISHVHGFGLLLLNLLVCKSDGGWVVDLDGGGGLRMAHFMKSGSQCNFFFCIAGKGPAFGFRCGRHDIAHNSGRVQDGSIVVNGWTDWCIFA